MRITFKILLSIFLIIILLISYLSIFGIETDKFNNQILNKVKEIDKRIKVELKEIKLVLDPFNLKLNIKTIGTELEIQNKKIELENIKSQISLESLINNKFSIENLEISTKSLEIKNLISVLRSFRNTPELFILEKTLKKGYLIADIKMNFDSNGGVKDDYVINGFIKEAKFDIIRKYYFQKIDLNFEYKKEELLLNDIRFSLNDLNFTSEKLNIKKDKNDFLVSGNVNHKKFNINKKNFKLLLKPLIPNFDIEKVLLSSSNKFSFKIKKDFKFEDFETTSKIFIDELLFINNFNLKNFFPKLRKNISFSNHELSLKFKKNNLSINGKGKILFQKNADNLDYTLNINDKFLNFKTSLQIKDNPFIIDFLNYKKNEDNNAQINVLGSKDQKDEILVNSLNLDEGKNKIRIKNLAFNKKKEIIRLDKLHLDYLDTENQKNLIKLDKNADGYILKGPYFNANNLIENLLSSNEKDTNIFNIDSNLEINIDKLLLDSEYYLKNFSGIISFNNKEIFKANLLGYFSNNEKLKFTVNTTNNNKITTLFVDKAEPLVRRYKFIKGFEDGSLDFYSSKKSGESISQIKIYDFKLKELPVLTKILTLASLQGIADILSGEGIRFDEFEMNFKNKGNLLTIDEIYAIGPAISILMEGYVEKKRLVSLRGTLVPATTINKFIGSLPVLGKILVGKKTGEGVFGVSFKIKGPPEKMETAVNPIKSLTPRFITRTLEKIKKN